MLLNFKALHISLGVNTFNVIKFIVKFTLSKAYYTIKLPIPKRIPIGRKGA